MSNNPKCPVFGCTIPRGIPHEHPQQEAGIERFLDGIPINRLDQFEGGPMVPGRKLRDALLEAGNIQRTESTSFNVPGGGSVTVDTTPIRSDVELGEVRRLSVVQIAGRIATGIVLAVGATSVVILMAMTAGWL